MRCERRLVSRAEEAAQRRVAPRRLQLHREGGDHPAAAAATAAAERAGAKRERGERRGLVGAREERRCVGAQHVGREAQAHEQGVAVDNGRTARAAAVVQLQPQKLVARVHELRR